MTQRRVFLWAAVTLAVASVIVFPWSWAFAVGVHPYPAGTPWTYQLWSGFIPGMTISSVFAGVASHVRLVNCHVHGCPRVGRYPLAGGEFKVCGKHSPHPGKLTSEYVLARHAAHEQRQENAAGSPGPPASRRP